MPAPEPKVGEIIAGKYRVESVLGRGGMGVVFAARHTISERRVAVKWMEADLQDEPDALERFVREARAMGRIEHPNVVGVLDVGTDAEVAYLVMEILRGESLRTLMTREPRLPAERALETLLPVLEGVEAAHRAGVVHRDLKPENLFVVHGAAGKPVTTKVLDFGISKLTESDAKRRDAKRLTKTGHVVGTPTYMSPEQVRGTTIDARTDVWALSTILYEMLAGRTPFDGDNYGALLVAIAVESYEPLDPRVVAPDLARVIHKGLAKEPDERWPSVLALARALEPFARGAKFHEPRRPSLVPDAPPADRGRDSALPTIEQGGGRPTTPDDPTRAAVPPLATPAPRGAPATRTPIASAPTPVRMPRPAAAEPVASTIAPTASSRRLVTFAAIALALVVALVLVIRGIGNAARNAMLEPDPSPTEATSMDTPPTPSEPEVAVPVELGTIAPAPGAEGLGDENAIGAAMPAAPSAPPEAAPAPSASHAHREGSAHPHPSVAPTPSDETSAPPSTTTTSRSGSIRREDF